MSSDSAGQRWCRQCGTQVREGARFCRECGHDNLPQDETQATATAPPTSAPDPPQSGTAASPGGPRARFSRRIVGIALGVLGGAAVAIVIAVALGSKGSNPPASTDVAAVSQPGVPPPRPASEPVSTPAETDPDTPPEPPPPPPNEPAPGPTSDTIEREWLDQGLGDPVVNVVEALTPSISGTRASVQITLYSRDRQPPAGSDSQCRRFIGTMVFTRSGGKWTWNHPASRFDATPINPPSSNCP